LLIGTACKAFDECESGSDCRGPQGSTFCVAYASPGESCSAVSTVSIPFCGTGSCLNSICRGGFVNDTCSSSLDCHSRLCDERTNYCLGFPNTASCEYTYQCAPGLFCKVVSGQSNGTCASLLTTGVCGGNECAPGYDCESPSASDKNQCIQHQTKNPGDYCGNSDRLCKGSKRCLNGYCAKAAGEFCNSGDNGQCAIDQTCTCGGMRVLAGTGSCTGTCAVSASEDYMNCIVKNCQPGSAGNYKGSCENRLCKAQLDAYYRCASGSSLTVSFSLISFFAFLAFFFNKF